MKEDESYGKEENESESEDDERKIKQKKENKLPPNKKVWSSSESFKKHSKSFKYR